MEGSINLGCDGLDATQNGPWPILLLLLYVKQYKNYRIVQHHIEMETCKGPPEQPTVTPIYMGVYNRPLRHCRKSTVVRRPSSQVLTTRNSSNRKRSMESFCGHPHQSGRQEIKGKVIQNIKKCKQENWPLLVRKTTSKTMEWHQHSDTKPLKIDWLKSLEIGRSISPKQ